MRNWWSVPPIWEGGECWIIGGGPSLTREFKIPDEVVQSVLFGKASLSAYSPYMTAIHDKHVIGVNMAFRLGNWVDVVFFGDKKWYIDNRDKMLEFKKLKVTCHQFFDKPQFHKEGVKVLNKAPTTQGISSDPRAAAWNANSGAAAISVAANMGAKRIVLVGFDMKLDGEKLQHWHAEYGTFNRFKNHQKVRADLLPFLKHLACFPKIAHDARQRGISIVNACPDSRITVFPRMSVEEALSLKKFPEIDPVPLAAMRKPKRPPGPGPIREEDGTITVVHPGKHGRRPARKIIRR
jgi:hypothetical protein